MIEIFNTHNQKKEQHVPQNEDAILVVASLDLFSQNILFEEAHMTNTVSHQAEVTTAIPSPTTWRIMVKIDIEIGLLFVNAI